MCLTWWWISLVLGGAVFDCLHLLFLFILVHFLLENLHLDASSLGCCSGTSVARSDRRTTPALTGIGTITVFPTIAANSVSPNDGRRGI